VTAGGARPKRRRVTAGGARPDRRRVTGVGVTLAVALAGSLAAPAVADPRGAIEVGGELLVTGGKPRQRAGVAVTGYLTRRLGLRAAVHLVTVDPLADAGLATIGVSYRAAAARPRLELVVRAEAGVAWPTAPAVGAGATIYLWPTRAPLALTVDLGATAIVDGVRDSRLGLGLGLGLALAR
jgi:hypothetical protein